MPVALCEMGVGGTLGVVVRGGQKPPITANMVPNEITVITAAMTMAVRPRPRRFLAALRGATLTSLVLRLAAPLGADCKARPPLENTHSRPTLWEGNAAVY